MASASSLTWVVNVNPTCSAPPEISSYVARNPGKKESTNDLRALAITAALGAMRAFHGANKSRIEGSVLREVPQQGVALNEGLVHIDKRFEVGAVVLADDGIHPLATHLTAPLNQLCIVWRDHDRRKPSMCSANRL